MKNNLTLLKVGASVITLCVFGIAYLFLRKIDLPLLWLFVTAAIIIWFLMKSNNILVFRGTILLGSVLIFSIIYAYKPIIYSTSNSNYYSNLDTQVVLAWKYAAQTGLKLYEDIWYPYGFHYFKSNGYSTFILVNLVNSSIVLAITMCILLYAPSYIIGMIVGLIFWFAIPILSPLTGLDGYMPRYGLAFLPLMALQINTHFSTRQAKLAGIALFAFFNSLLFVFMFEVFTHTLLGSIAFVAGHNIFVANTNRPYGARFSGLAKDLFFGLVLHIIFIAIFLSFAQLQFNLFNVTDYVDFIRGLPYPKDSSSSAFNFHDFGVQKLLYMYIMASTYFSYRVIVQRKYDAMDNFALSIYIIACLLLFKLIIRYGIMHNAFLLHFSLLGIYLYWRVTGYLKDTAKISKYMPIFHTIAILAVMALLTKDIGYKPFIDLSKNKINSFADILHKEDTVKIELEKKFVPTFIGKNIPKPMIEVHDYLSSMLTEEDRIFPFPSDVVYYIWLNKTPLKYLTPYDGAFKTAQLHNVNQLSGVKYVIFNTKGIVIDQVPYYVRAPFVTNYILVNYKPIKKFGSYYILIRKDKNESSEYVSDLARSLLLETSTLNLGYVPAIMGRDNLTLDGSDPNNANNHVKFTLTTKRRQCKVIIKFPKKSYTINISTLPNDKAHQYLIDYRFLPFYDPDHDHDGYLSVPSNLTSVCKIELTT